LISASSALNRDATPLFCLQENFDRFIANTCVATTMLPLNNAAIDDDVTQVQARREQHRSQVPPLRKHSSKARSIHFNRIQQHLSCKQGDKPVN